MLIPKISCFTTREQKRFFSKIYITDDCWIWHGTINATGYGVFFLSYNRKQILSHRYSYQLFYKTELTTSRIIRHKCDNPLCINPRHLIIGSHADNVKDRVERGRSAIGENNGRSKLTIKDVKYIRKNYRQHSRKELANIYSVDRKVVYDIIHNNTWKDI